ncbi:UNVERIFIED_CONTAM: hypothetical protein FKN15_006752 [Acipenser sinensis]
MVSRSYSHRRQGLNNFRWWPARVRVPPPIRRGQQSRGIRLSAMAMTRRGGEEGVCAFPLSEWLRGGPWETARPIRTGLVMRSGGHVGGSTQCRWQKRPA